MAWVAVAGSSSGGGMTLQEKVKRLLDDMLERQRQLEAWTADLATPKVTWLSGCASRSSDPTAPASLAAAALLHPRERSPRLVSARAACRG